MTQDEIIRMAREAGFSERDAMGRSAFLGNSYDLERFYQMAFAAGATHEREKQAEQEPVGYFAYDEEHDIWEELTGPNTPGATPLYAAPIRVQDLTDDEIDEIYSEYGSIPNTKAIRAVITKDREKNK